MKALHWLQPSVQPISGQEIQIQKQFQIQMQIQIKYNKNNVTLANDEFISFRRNVFQVMKASVMLVATTGEDAGKTFLDSHCRPQSLK